MKHRSTFWIFGGLALAICAFAPLGKAAISDQLVITTGDGDSVTISPGGGIVYNAQCITDSCSVSTLFNTNTEISVGGTLGNFILHVDDGIDSLGLTAPAVMDLTINDAKNLGVGNGKLTIDYTETGMTTTYGGFNGTGGGTQDGKTVTYNALLSGVQFGTTGPLTNPSPGPGSNALFGGSLSTSSGASGTYTLTQEVVLAFDTKGEDDSGDFSLSSVPEPTSVTLLGGILALTASALRRKMRKKA